MRLLDYPEITDERVGGPVVLRHASKRSSGSLEFVINHQTARLLGFTVPPLLLARADEVIE